MKKLLYLFVLVLFSCSTESAKEADDTSSSTLEEITERHNIANEFEKATYVKHEIEIGLSQENLVLVNKINGNYETFHVIQLNEEDIPKFKNLKSGTFEVANFHRELIISNENSNIYFTTLQEPKYAEFFKGDQITSVIGISENIIDEDLPKNDLGELDFSEIVSRARCGCVYLHSYKYCASGGEGASYCSGSGCAVGCNQGYYACCN